MPAPAFVLSTGRCGSTLLSTMLGAHPTLVAISEFLYSQDPDPFPGGIVEPARLLELLTTPRPRTTLALRHGLEPSEFLYPVDGPGRYTRSTGVPPIATTTLPALTDDPDALLDELEPVVLGFPPAPIGAHYRRLFDWLAERFGGEAWVERSGSSLGYAQGVVESFPDTRIVHLFRDGREVALSMSRRIPVRLALVGAEFRRRFGFDPYLDGEKDAPADLPEPFPRLLPSSFDPTALREYPIALEVFGRLWSAMILRGLRQLDRLPPGSVLPVAYEDLVARPAETLTGVAGFLGVEVESGWLEAAAGLVRPSAGGWADLEEPLRASLEAACAIANRRLYGPSGPPDPRAGGQSRGSATMRMP